MHHIKYTTLSHIKKQTIGEVLAEVKKVRDLYKRCGFQVNEIHTDPEFNPLCAAFIALRINYNQVATSEHVPEVEQQIRVIKERVWCVWSQLPYNVILKKIVLVLAQMVVLWLNNFLPKCSVSDTLSLRQTVLGTKLDMRKHC